MMESTDGAPLATKKQPVGLPLWRGSSAPQAAAPGRHSPLLDDRPLPPSPPPHEPLQPVRRAWGGGAVPLVAGSPLPDVGAFSYSSYPSTLPALGSPGPGPQQQKEDEGEKIEKDEDEDEHTSNYKKEEEVGWISVESAHTGAIAPLPPSPRPPQAVEEEKEGEAHNAPGQELGSPAGGTASRPTSTGVAAGAYDIAISAPFDFPRDDTQGYSTFSPSYAQPPCVPPRLGPCAEFEC